MADERLSLCGPFNTLKTQIWLTSKCSASGICWSCAPWLGLYSVVFPYVW